MGYTGHQSDVATGLTYMQARYYDPVVGRFMAADPVGFTPANAMSFNRHFYANNNPYRYVDPDGRYGRGTGFTDGQWERFNRAQQSAARRMERKAAKLERQANKLDEKGKDGADAARATAAALTEAAKILRMEVNDGYVVNDVDSATYQKMGGSETGAAFVKGNGPIMILNVDGEGVARNSRVPYGHILGHEALHSAGFNDQSGSNDEKAYKYGNPLREPRIESSLALPRR